MYLISLHINLKVKNWFSLSAGWASRAYYSDNGSTAVEIALKMAFRKFSFDHGIAVDSDNGIVDDRCYDFKVSVTNRCAYLLLNIWNI